MAQAIPSTEPSSTHIFPAGGQRGTVVAVRVGAECLPPGSNLQLLGQGVSAPTLLGSRAKLRGEPSPRRIPSDADNGEPINYPKEWESTIRIAADAPPGVVAWRATCGWGGTRPRPFIIGDLPEFVESESNSNPSHAERIALPITVNGQIAGERDVDYFHFHAVPGDVVVCDVLAARIGSPLDPVVEIRDSRDQRVPLQEIRVGMDPVLAFRVTTTDDYILSIANISVRGGPEYVYRTTISTKPYIAFALPESNREMTLLALDGTGGFQTVKHRAHAGPELLVRDNHAVDRAMALPSTADVIGRFLTNDAEDWYTFTGRKGEAAALHCRPFSTASLACPIVSIEDGSGKLLAHVRGVESPTRDCRFEWRAPADGTYRLRVRDQQHGSRCGPEYIYRLSLKPTRPGFALMLAADYLNVIHGGRAELDLHVERNGGFMGPIDLAVHGLPDGVRLETPRVPANVSKFKLAFSASNESRPTSAELSITGIAVGVTGMSPVPARVVHVGGPEGALMTAGRADKLHLTVQHKPIFKLTCNEAYQYAHRGTVYPYTLTIERLNGFEGEITLQIADRQVQDLDGIDIVERIVPPGVKETAALVYLPETMNPNAQHHSRPYVQGYATFTDKWGQRQAMLALCDKRCMIRAMPPIAKLKAVDDQFVASPGQLVECRLLLARTSNFTGRMEIELAEPVPGITLETTHIDAGQTNATARIRLDKGSVPKEGRVLKLRGMGRLSGEAYIVSETTITLRPGP